MHSWITNGAHLQFRHIFKELKPEKRTACVFFFLSQKYKTHLHSLVEVHISFLFALLLVSKMTSFQLLQWVDSIYFISVLCTKKCLVLGRNKNISMKALCEIHSPPLALYWTRNLTIYSICLYCYFPWIKWSAWLLIVSHMKYTSL